MNSSPAIVVMTGKGIESFPLFIHAHDKARIIKLYHYTNREGFEGLTSNEAQWLPSLGAPKSESVSAFPLPGHEDEFPPESVISRPSLSRELSSLVTFMVIGLPQEMVDLSNIVYGPGWYMTDLPPSTSTDELLHNLWGGNPAKRARTAFWVGVTISEFKARTPDPLRPRVKFAPIKDKIGLTAEHSLFCQSLSAVALVSGGTRVETASGRVRVRRLYHKRTELIPPHQFLIEGWLRLGQQARDNILRYFGIRDEVIWPTDSDQGRAIDLTHALAQDGAYLEALHSADELIRRHPDVADLWSNRGAVLAKLGRRAEAINCYVRALELRPDYPQARINLTASLVRLGRFEEALGCVNDVIAEHPDNADAWYNRGACLRSLKEWNAAARSYERFIELAPEHSRAARAQISGKYCRFRNVIGWPTLQFQRLARLRHRW